MCTLEDLALNDPLGSSLIIIYLFYKFISIIPGYISVIACTAFYCNYLFMLLSPQKGEYNKSGNLIKFTIKSLKLMLCLALCKCLLNT